MNKPTKQTTKSPYKEIGKRSGVPGSGFLNLTTSPARTQTEIITLSFTPKLPASLSAHFCFVHHPVCPSPGLSITLIMTASRASNQHTRGRGHCSTCRGLLYGAAWVVIAVWMEMGTSGRRCAEESAEVVRCLLSAGLC